MIVKHYKALTTALIIVVNSANAQVKIDLGNLGGDSTQRTAATRVTGIDETSSFATGTFSLGANAVTFTLNTAVRNGSLSGQDVGWGVSGGSDANGIDNGSSGLEALTFTLSDITGLGIGQSLVFTEFGVRWGKSGADEYYTVNGGSEVAFPSSTCAVSLADLATLTVGAGPSGATGFALDYVTVNVVPELSASALRADKITTLAGAGGEAPSPIIDSFTVDLDRVSPGAQIRLSWKVANHDSLMIGWGVVGMDAPTVGGVGSITLPIKETTKFTLIASRGGICTSSSLRVVVGEGASDHN